MAETVTVIPTEFFTDAGWLKAVNINSHPNVGDDVIIDSIPYSVHKKTFEFDTEGQPLLVRIYIYPHTPPPPPPLETQIPPEIPVEEVPPPEETIPPTVPILNNLMPNTAVVGDPDVTVSVFGTGYTPDVVVVYDGHDVGTIYMSEIELTILVSPMAAVIGVIQIQVRNEAGLSNALDFTFTV